MRKIYLLLYGLTLTLAAHAQSGFDYATDFPKIAAQTAKPQSPVYYPTLLKRFLANDQTLSAQELLALQIGHTCLPTYRPYLDIAIERQLYDLNDKKDFAAALQAANIYQQRNPLSLMLNLEKSYALSKTGQADSSSLYLGRYKQLMGALLASGDGTKKPYFVLSPIDGQLLITRFWGGELGIMGSGRDKKGNMLDMLDMRDGKTGTTKTYLFHIQHATATMLK